MRLKSSCAVSTMEGKAGHREFVLTFPRMVSIQAVQKLITDACDYLNLPITGALEINERGEICYVWLQENEKVLQISEKSLSKFSVAEIGARFPAIERVRRRLLHVCPDIISGNLKHSIDIAMIHSMSGPLEDGVQPSRQGRNKGGTWVTSI